MCPSYVQTKCLRPERPTRQWNEQHTTSQHRER